MRIATYAVAVALLAPSGCAVNPKVQTPKARAPRQWSGTPAHGVVVESPAVRLWCAPDKDMGSTFGGSALEPVSDI
jgi:hypothetical protein